MLLTALLLTAALAPQEAQAPARPQAAPAQAPALAVKPTAAPAESKAVGDAAGAKAAPEATGPIAEGLAAFRRHKFAKARAAFEKAVDADPQSAAAAFYLGYTYYKLGEPSHRLNANKEKAKELFAKAFSLDPAFKPAWGR